MGLPVAYVNEDACNPMFLALCAGADGGKGGYVSQEVEALKREWSRHEAIMRAIADPSTPGVTLYLP